MADDRTRGIHEPVPNTEAADQRPLSASEPADRPEDEDCEDSGAGSFLDRFFPVGRR